MLIKAVKLYSCSFGAYIQIQIVKAFSDIQCFHQKQLQGKSGEYFLWKIFWKNLVSSILSSANEMTGWS